MTPSSKWMCTGCAQPPLSPMRVQTSRVPSPLKPA
jgi:hypothetical protein